MNGFKYGIEESALQETNQKVLQFSTSSKKKKNMNANIVFLLCNPCILPRFTIYGSMLLGEDYSAPPIQIIWKSSSKNWGVQ